MFCSGAGEVDCGFFGFEEYAFWGFGDFKACSFLDFVFFAEFCGDCGLSFSSYYYFFGFHF